ncbi:MAG: AAA family ATPase [Bacteroidetes bacterium]|nr:AAA family ATPase [Bacteroidota bacterium]MDP3638444.1 AAA family ATPase [Azonexus sp.]
MKIRISKILIENFKSFEKLEMIPNESFNIIIGENNAGKSTLFEAIHLWERCYKGLIQTNKKDFYQVSGTTSRYISYQDLDFLRLAKDEDLFNKSTRAKATISITLTVDGVSFDLGINISSPATIINAFYRIQPVNPADFSGFAKHLAKDGKKLDEAIFIYQTRPVANVSQNEPYLNEGQIKKKIQRGQSHEVLRNKITLKHDSQSKLEESMSKILGKPVIFELPSKSRRAKDEYISLLVKSGGKSLDIHLQGSGFLQVAEIISTIEYIDAPLKLLLVDEPDSHIHCKLQKNLIDHLREIEDNQFFIISHNDQFVTNANDNEVFFLNHESKKTGKLSPIPSSSFDSIKMALGGVIMALEKLNNASHIVFVEGTDDAKYIDQIISRYNTISGNNKTLDHCHFFPLRGKDNILKKLEYNKRTLSGLFNGKSYMAVFDRDFSTDDIDLKLKSDIKNKLGKSSAACYSHNGYCIESSIFSEADCINRLICLLTINDEQKDSVSNYTTEFFNKIKAEIKSVASETYLALKESFKGQKSNRPEFESLEFDDFVRDILSPRFRIQNVMTKSIIRDYVIHMESRIGSSLFLRQDNDPDTVSSNLFLLYIDNINHLETDMTPFLEILKVVASIEIETELA